MSLKAIHSLEQDPQLGCWTAEFTVHGREDFPVDSVTIALFVDWEDGQKTGAILQRSCELTQDDMWVLVDVAMEFSNHAKRRTRRMILQATNKVLRGDS